MVVVKVVVNLARSYSPHCHLCLATAAGLIFYWEKDALISEPAKLPSHLATSWTEFGKPGSLVRDFPIV